jgi:methyltransferase (TIGR00027 family)
MPDAASATGSSSRQIGGRSVVKESGVPRTAILSAMMRAAHLLLDGEPKIFSDPFALSLSGFEGEAGLTAALGNFVATLEADAGVECARATFNYLRAGMTMRSRYTEDELSDAVQRGIAQYVILGAGLDSFVYRRKTLAPVLRVFEVDLPSSQRWKRERLRALNMAEPDGMVFVPLDFERQRLVDGLRAAGYRVDRPAFFSWLGTTQYLTAKAVFKTLKEIASLAAGSEVVFTYQVTEDALAGGDRQVLHVLKARAAQGGAPWVSSFEPAALVARLKGSGFSDAVAFGPERALTRYFAARTDGLVVPRLSHLMKARVGGAAAAR